jgi:hypothetical protein
MKEKEVVETSSPSINANPERNGKYELTFDRELHA